MSKIYDGGYVPVNRAAAMAISPQKTDEVTLPKKFFREHWDVPPPMREITDDLRKNPGFVDLTGRTFGRRKVVGLSAKVVDQNSTYWVLRCVCGIYELQRGRALKRGSAPDRCCWCTYNEFLQHDGSKRLVGSADGGPWEECPALDEEAVKRAHIDFSQCKFGDLTVLGLPKENRTKKFRTWVVRCSCGLYERRNIKTLIKKFEKEGNVMCATCAYKLER